MTYQIKFHLVSETGYQTKLTFDNCINISINDDYFEFFDLTSGTLYKYYLRDIPNTQAAKTIDEIEVKQNV